MSVKPELDLIKMPRYFTELAHWNEEYSF